MVTAAQVKNGGAWFGNVHKANCLKHFSSLSLFFAVFSISFHIRNVFFILTMSIFVCSWYMPARILPAPKRTFLKEVALFTINGYIAGVLDQLSVYPRGERLGHCVRCRR